MILSFFAKIAAIHGKRVAPYLEQSIVSAGNFLTIVLCARQLDFGDQGYLGVLLAVYFGCSNINLAAIYSLGAVKVSTSDCRSNYFENLLLTQTLLMLFVTPAAILLFVLMTGAPWHITTLALMFLVLAQIAEFSRRVAYFSEQPGQAVAISSMVYLPRLLVLGFVPLPSFAACLLSMTSITFLAVLCCGRQNLRLSFARWADQLHFLRTHLREAQWLIASAPLAWALSNLPIFVLNMRLGLSAVGQYATARGFSGLANVGLELLDTHLAGVLARKRALGKNEYFAFMFKVVGFGFSMWLLVFVLIVFGGEVFLIKIGLDAYAVAVPVIETLWVAKLIEFGGRLSSIHLRVERATRGILQATSAALFIVGASGAFLVHLYGILGAALMVLLESSVIFIWQLHQAAFRKRSS